MVKRFKDDAGRTYEISNLDEKAGKWHATIDWISHNADPARVTHALCIVPGEFDSEQKAEDAAHHFAKNNRPE